MSSIENTTAGAEASSLAFKRWFMCRMIAVLTGGMLLDGYILGIIGPVTAQMKADLGLSTFQIGLEASAALFGILIGSLWAAGPATESPAARRGAHGPAAGVAGPARTVRGPRDHYRSLATA